MQCNRVFSNQFLLKINSHQTLIKISLSKNSCRYVNSSGFYTKFLVLLSNNQLNHTIFLINSTDEIRESNFTNPDAYNLILYYYLSKLEINNHNGV